MATATLVVTYTDAAGDGKAPTGISITIDGSDLAAARTTLEKRAAWFAAKATLNQITRLGLLPLGASPDQVHA